MAKRLTKREREHKEMIALVPRPLVLYDVFDQEDELPDDMVGAEIVGIGSPAGRSRLAIDYIPKGSREVMRIVLGAGDRGLWIDLDGVLRAPPEEETPGDLPEEDIEPVL